VILIRLKGEFLKNSVFGSGGGIVDGLSCLMISLDLFESVALCKT
jgi:hypothetical protein